MIVITDEFNEYIFIRNRLQTGDILLFSGKGFFSWLIKRATRSPISHVGMVYVIGGNVFVWESTSLSKGKRGVQISLLSERIKNYKGKIWVRNLKADRTAEFYRILKELREEIKGRDYENNLWELLGAVLPFRNKPNLTSVFCSEQIAEAFIRWRFLTSGLPANKYIPGDFSLGEIIDDDLKYNSEPVCLGTEMRLK